MTYPPPSETPDQNHPPSSSSLEQLKKDAEPSSGEEKIRIQEHPDSDELSQINVIRIEDEEDHHHPTSINPVLQELEDDQDAPFTEVQEPLKVNDSEEGASCEQQDEQEDVR